MTDSPIGPLEGSLALSPEAIEEGKIRERIRDYILRSGLTNEDFARRIGYSGDTIKKFLGDRYFMVRRSQAHIMKAALEFIKAHPIAPPTGLHGDIYETANVRMIRDVFQQLIPRPVAYMLYAPPGSQKTFVLQHEVARHNREELHKNGHGTRAYYVYCRQNIRPRDLMKRIAIACGSRGHNDIDQMLANLRWEFGSRRVLLILDEAQHLSLECLEVVRELLDQPPHFSLLLDGSHALPKLFNEAAHQFEQWNSRIIAKVCLPGLQREEARAIVRREVGDILQSLKEADQYRMVDSLIDSATVIDTFAQNKNQKYVNVRTLTNALNQIKAASAAKQEAIA